MSFSMSLFLILLIPIVGAFFIYAYRKKENQRESVTFITAISIFLCVINLFIGDTISRETVDVITFFPGVTLSFFYDHLSIVFAFVASS